MSETRMLIIAHVEEAKEAYAEALARLDVACDVAFSFHEAQRMAIESTYCGVLIDILTLVRSTQEEKLIAYDFINLYPTIRLKWDKRSRQLNLAPLEQSFSVPPQQALDFFIQKRCSSFRARSLRRHPRVNICLDVLLSAKELVSEQESIKTFTVNISNGGAFLHTTQSFESGQSVWLQIKEFSDPTPIKAQVCWKIAWGAGSRSVPGIGVEFEVVSERQRDELRQLTKSAKDKEQAP